MSDHSRRVSEHRRSLKARLVEYHGGKCADCGITGPPFIFDFDHINPAEKSFNISNSGRTKSYAKLLEESMKCRLVCATCHRYRTHRQRCDGCEYC